MNMQPMQRTSNAMGDSINERPAKKQRSNQVERYDAFDARPSDREASLRTVQLLGMQGLRESRRALHGCLPLPSSTTAEALDRHQYANTIVRQVGRRLPEVWNAASVATMNPSYMRSTFDAPQAHLYPQQQQQQYHNSTLSSDIATYLRVQALERMNRSTMDALQRSATTAGGPALSNASLIAFAMRQNALVSHEPQGLYRGFNFMPTTLAAPRSFVPIPESPSGRFSAAFAPQVASQPRSLIPPREINAPVCLPVIIANPDDKSRLTDNQVFLRFQIEVFQATEADATVHTRGRNKAVQVGQVGIRCRHCATLAVLQRQKGSTYFPASIFGLYQAAQNMNTSHMQSGICAQMPDPIKSYFATTVAVRKTSSGAGRSYWAKSAQSLGLVDTENGIYSANDNSSIPGSA